MLCDFIITGNSNGTESNGDGVWDGGRAYSGRGRGRGRGHGFCRQGRGYGGEVMQKESSGYNEFGGSEAPPRLWRGRIIFHGTSTNML